MFVNVHYRAPGCHGVDVCLLVCVLICVNVRYRAPGCHGVDVCLLMCITEHQAVMVLMYVC